MRRIGRALTRGIAIIFGLIELLIIASNIYKKIVGIKGISAKMFIQSDACSKEIELKDKLRIYRDNNRTIDWDKFTQNIAMKLKNSNRPWSNYLTQYSIWRNNKFSPYKSRNNSRRKSGQTFMFEINPWYVNWKSNRMFLKSADPKTAKSGSRQLTQITSPNFKWNVNYENLNDTVSNQIFSTYETQNNSIDQNNSKVDWKDWSCWK